MRKESHTTITTTKVLMYVQLAASIVPILAHIALAIMAWMQNNWMMLAMIVPSIMMYVTSLVPQILQYLTQQQNTQNAELNQQIPQEPYSSAANFSYEQSCEENLPDNLTPVSLETLLMNRNAACTTQPPWKTVLYTWLKNITTNCAQNTLESANQYIASHASLPNTKQKHLIAPLGVSNNGYCYMDLINNGPHALVAGTTGSGKSVLLTTWCLALAFQYAPEQLHFVFMDFKGGATFDALSTLPHTVGNVGDLNLQHATRALRGLELELDRRERLVARQGCHNISQVTPAEPSLLIVIDEFHALKDQLPDYMPRLIRIASVGRSLGMHIIAGTQNPLGQVSADMKANIAINICLRVRDGMQSQELLGTSQASHISPHTPGSAYYNIGEGVTSLRCAQSQNPRRLVRAIQLAGRFCHHEYSPTLFSAPLPSLLSIEQLKRYEHKTDDNKIKVATHQQTRITNPLAQAVVIGLQDDSIHLSPAFLPLHLGNVAIIGGRQQGKSTILRIISQALQVPVYSGTTLTAQNVACVQHNVSPLLIDDADELLNPLNADQQAIAFQEQLQNSYFPIVFSTNTARNLRLPEQAPVRIIFPTGDVGMDTMLGIPTALSKTLDAQDYQLPGRCVIIAPGAANLVQVVWPNDCRK